MKRFLLVVFLLSMHVSMAEGGTVTITLSHAVRGPWIGFGVNMESLSWSSSTPSSTDWTNTYLPRLQWMKPPIIRLMMSANYTSSYLTQLYRILDYAQSHGIQIVLSEWGNGWSPVQMPGALLGDTTYTNAIGNYMQNLINTKGYTCIKYFILGNEPNYDPTNYASGITQWTNAVANTKAKFTSLGFTDSNFRIAGPDTSNADTWVTATASTYPTLVGAYDLHRYEYVSDLANAGFESSLNGIWSTVMSSDPSISGKPFMLGEAGIADGSSTDSNTNIGTFNYGLWMADYSVQAARGRVGAILVWNLDDDGVSGQDWGLWKSKANGYTLYPWWYTYSLLSRYVPKGSTIYAPSNPSSTVRVMGSQAPDGSWTFVAVNMGTSSTSITFVAPGNSSQTFQCYSYSSGGRTVDANGFPTPVSTLSGVPASGVTQTIPANSMVMLTAYDPEGGTSSQKPSPPQNLIIR
jgi:hypothetical protein